MTEPPEIVIPPRDWGDDDEAPSDPPTVIVSSREGHGDPGAAYVGARSAPWRGLAVKLGKLGWTVRTTYALAWVPDAHWQHAGLRKAGHYAHTIALRLSRAGVRAVAVWRRETVDQGMPGDKWSCDVAMIGRAPMGLNEWKATVSA